MTNMTEEQRLQIVLDMRIREERVITATIAFVLYVEANKGKEGEEEALARGDALYREMEKTVRDMLLFLKKEGAALKRPGPEQGRIQ